MLNKKKGNVLIEIPIIIGIVAIITVISFETVVKANRFYKLRNDIRKNTVIFKSVVGELRYNSKYSEINNKLDESSIFYINEANLTLDRIKINDIKNLMENTLTSEGKFIQIDANKSLDKISLQVSFKGKDSYDLKLEEWIYLSESLEL